MAQPGENIGTVMARLAEYMAKAPAAPLPPEVVEKTKHHILDSLAAMISGTRLKPGRLAIDYVKAEGGASQALIPGTGLWTTATNAALAGGICAHADETDDSHPRSFCHPGCAVVPAALAMGFREGASGQGILRAVALGYDLAARIGLALDPERIYGREHRSTHSMGALFGATGAAGALASLDADQCRWLISYAAQQTSGIATWARDDEHIEKAFDFGGMGARNGVAAACMVAAGFTGVDDVFSGPRNFFAAFGGDPEIMAADLGTRFEIMDTHIKKWSIGSPVQAPLAALEELIHEHGLTPENVAAIEALVPAVEADIVDSRSMPDICLQHLFAVMLIDKRVGFASSHDYARMTDPAVGAVMGRVTLTPDGRLPRREGAVRVRTADGETLSRHVPHVRGTTPNPMDANEVADKAIDLMAPILGDGRADDLVKAVWRLEKMQNARALAPLVEA